nr:hypothetical protein [Tanacetum cinerariifolium]
LHQLHTFYNALNPADQDSLNAVGGGNLLEKSPQDALMIIENKSKVYKSRSKPIASPVNACDNHSSSELAKLTHVVNQQTSAVTTAMTAILKQFQSNPPSAQVKAVEEICVTCGGAHPYYQCLTASGNTFPEFQDNIQDMVKNELRNEMKTSILTSLSNQTNEIKNMMVGLLQMNTASTSGSGTLPGNTIANPKGELKSITTRSGLVTKGPTVPNPPKSINPEEDECVEETYTDPDHNIKVPPPPPVQKPKPPIQRNFVLHTRDSLPPPTMTDNRTMAEMLRAPTERCAEAIVVPLILAEQFELKHSLINMMTSEQFFRLEKDNPHDHIRWFNKITSTIKYKDQKFNESFHEAWKRYKDLLCACPHYGFTELHQLHTFYNALNPADQDSLNAVGGGNLLEKSPQDALMIIENKSKVYKSRSKPIASLVNACDNHSSSEIAKLTHAVNQQTSAVTTAMTAMLKQLQSNPPPSQVKAVEEICVTCGGAHPYYQCLAADGNTFPEFRDNIQGYILAAAGNYNQGSPGYRPQGVANQMRPPGFAQPNVQNNQNRFGKPQGFNRGTNFNQEQPYQATAQSNQNFYLNELEKIKRMDDVSLKAMQNQIDMVKKELRNEMKTSIQTSLSNQTNEIKNMMASLLQMNTASTSGSGSLSGNTVANPKGELKVITTRSGLVTEGPTVPTPPKSVNPEEDECVEETYTDPDLAEYTIKVPPPQSTNLSLRFKDILFCILGTLLHRISCIPQEC